MDLLVGTGWELIAIDEPWLWGSAEDVKLEKGLTSRPSVALVTDLNAGSRVYLASRALSISSFVLTSQGRFCFAYQLKAFCDPRGS